MDQYLKRLSLSNPMHLMAVGFGSGLAPKAPGTFGSLAALPLMVLLSWWLPLWGYLCFLIVGFLVGIYSCHVASRAMGVHDHGGIVWDEFIGMGITMIAMPISWPSAIAGFILFRLFDITKPWPIRWLDKHVKGGFGIMIDDVLAGIMAWIIQLILFSCL
ncbi:phosphatidylglycerophosphatase A [Celerinatantimonas sp. MCCC 1A17872]|uniref:phosphatidylglycerophosphatase A family protein n=1 Tax=Celerinatantimonas sp. MCCC 1A17872 TaxID=3177514 RepID=UPI0038C76361